MDKGPDHFVYINKFIKDDEQQELLKQKGIFPYNYMKDVRVLRKKHLPKKEEFFNELTCQHITKDEYDFVQKVWDRFSCKHFKITWKFIFWQIVYYCVMFLKILEVIACNSTT